MHTWGDEEIDWTGIHSAAEYIGAGLRWWRVPVRDWKEKYGTVRVYCGLGWSSIHDITHPGWSYIQYRRGSLLWHLCYAYRFNRIVFSLLNLAMVPLHKYLYRRYYRRAVEKWPHLRQEILSAADYPELLGGIE